MFWRNFNPRQHFAQRFTATFAFHRENHRAGKGLEEAAQIIQRRFLRLDGEVRQRLVAEIGISDARFSAVRAAIFSVR
jgi:hypothetical protein